MYNNDDYEEEEEEVQNNNKLMEFYYNNKKLVWLLFGVIGFIIIVSILSSIGGGESHQEVPTISISCPSCQKEDAKSQNLTKRNSLKLKAEVKNVKNPRVTWESSNKEVASIQNSNLEAAIVGNSLGKATIKVSYTGDDNKTISDTFEVTVTEGDPNVKLTDVTLPNEDLMMGIGNEYTLVPSYVPSYGAYIEQKSFTSSNENVVTIDENGKVKAIGKGQAQITVKVNNDNSLSDTIMVYVLENLRTASLVNNVEQIKFSGGLEKIKVGQVATLSYDLVPQNGDLTKLTWSSSNESVVKVDNYGRVTGIAVGTAIVKVNSMAGFEVGNVTVEVIENIIDVTSITVPATIMELDFGAQQLITPIVKPDNASNKTLEFSSSNPSIAQFVSSDGGITGTILTNYTEGQAVLTIRSKGNNSITQNIYLTVKHNSGSGSESGSGSGSGSGSPDNSDKGFIISSSTKNVNDTSDKARDNPEVGPSTITFTFKDSSVYQDTYKLKICTYLYNTETACDPDTSSNVTEIVKGGLKNFIVINKAGLTAIKINEYNSSNKKLRNTKTYYIYLTSINDGGSGSQQQSGSGSQQQSGSGCYCNPINGRCSIMSSAPSGYIKQTQILTEKGCQVYSNNNENGCFKNSSGKYVWGSYGTKSGYTNIDSISASSNCPSASADISWSSKKSGTINASGSTPSTLQSATISSGETFKVYYCVANSGSSCTVNISEKTNYYNRNFNVEAKQDNDAVSCSSGDGGKTHYIDSSAPNGGITWSSNKQSVTIPFCFNNGQSIKIRVVFSDNSYKEFSSHSFN